MFKLISMTITQLNYVLAVAQFKNFTKAATKTLNATIWPSSIMLFSNLGKDIRKYICSCLPGLISLQSCLKLSLQLTSQDKKQLFNGL